MSYVYTTVDGIAWRCRNDTPSSVARVVSRIPAGGGVSAEVGDAIRCGIYGAEVGAARLREWIGGLPFADECHPFRFGDVADWNGEIVAREIDSCVPSSTLRVGAWRASFNSKLVVLSIAIDDTHVALIANALGATRKHPDIAPLLSRQSEAPHA